MGVAFCFFQPNRVRLLDAHPRMDSSCQHGWQGLEPVVSCRCKSLWSHMASRRLTMARLAATLPGIKPHRPYDDDYCLSAQLLTRQLATPLAVVVSSSPETTPIIL